MNRQIAVFGSGRVTYPRADLVTVEAAVDGLMAWREVVMGHGVLSHGIVNCPYIFDADVGPAVASGATPGASTAGRPGWASWHVLTAVVRIPPVSPEFDLGELLARLVGAQLDPEAAAVESFTTVMGCGTGLVLQPSISVPADAAQAWNGIARALAEEGIDSPGANSLRYGLAAALAFPAGGGLGLLVTGMCMDPRQVLEVAGLVAVIAGRSHVGNLDDANSEAT